MSRTPAGCHRRTFAGRLRRGPGFATLTGLGLALALLPTACSQIQLFQRSAAIETVWIGEPSPDFRFRTLEGSEVQLSDLRGKRVLLSFWATWCLPCRVEIPALDALLREHPDSGAAVFAISDESEAVIRAFAAEQAIRLPLSSLPESSRPAPYNHLPALPAIFVIDRDGTIEDVHFGLIGDHRLAQALLDPSERDARR